MANKLPSFQFYPGDWLKDSALQRCTLAAQGVWIKTLCFMFECERRGVLRTNGKPWSKVELARVLGCKVAIIEELILANVLRVSARTQTMWSKRIILDERFRQMRARHGAKGGTNHRSKREANHQAKGKQTSKQTPKQTAPPSSSSSSSDKGDKPPLPPALDIENFRIAWDSWLLHLRQKRKTPTKSAMERQLQCAESWGVERAIAAINYSITGNYQGLFESKDFKHANGNAKITPAGPWSEKPYSPG